MFQKLLQPSEFARLFACMASSAIFALGLCGCQVTASDVTGSIGEKAEKSRAADPRRDVELYQERYKANPKDTDAALQYGKALRATGQKSQAVAVLEQTTLADPSNKALLAGYGRALADNGNFQQAFDVLGRAHSPENPDWRILSAQGAALDQLGRFEEARQYYASALKIVPDEPAVLSNLGLSYVLSKDLPKAEETCAALIAARARIRGCGPTWRWWWACAATWQRRKDCEGRPATRRRGREHRAAEAVAVPERERARRNGQDAGIEPGTNRLTVDRRMRFLYANWRYPRIKSEACFARKRLSRP